MTIHPAPVNTGICFKRIDLPDTPIIKATVEHVGSTQRSTNLVKGNAAVHTVEHLLSAFYALQIDNAIVELDNIEIPILNGSAAPFVEQIQAVGIEEQNEAAEIYTLSQMLRFYDEEKDAELIAIPSNHFEVTTMIDFQSSVLGSQHANLFQLKDYPTTIAPARTFCFLHELEYLLDNNLIKGGDLDNALVVVDHPPSPTQLERLATKFGKASIEVNQQGYLNNAGLNFPNEPARHKLLDLIGDLSLLGVRLQARIIANKPGHQSNVAFAKQLKKQYLQEKKWAEIPVYDPEQAAVYDISQIMESLPHRFPFLLVDKITKISDKEVIGIKNVTFNERYFQGHFPNHPVMPGVLIVEAMAQAGGVLLLSTVSNPKDYVTYFLKMDKVRFRKAVKPGDTLIFKLALLRPIRRGICEMKGLAYVGKKLVAEAEVTAKIMQRR